MAATPSNYVQPFSTGMSAVYLGLGSQKSAKFFGWCEGHPKHERRPDYMPVMSDPSGRRKPMDMSFQGVDATISLSMTAWDEGMSQMLEQMPDFLGQSGLGVPGSYRFADVGTLMGLEGFAIPVWIAYGNGDGIQGFTKKRAYTDHDLVNGYMYYQCIPFAPISGQEGAQPQIKDFMFYVWSRANFQTLLHNLFRYINTAECPSPTAGPVAA